jgi:hypothetical protein
MKFKKIKIIISFLFMLIINNNSYMVIRIASPSISLDKLVSTLYPNIFSPTESSCTFLNIQSPFTQSQIPNLCIIQ